MSPLARPPEPSTRRSEAGHRTLVHKVFPLLLLVIVAAIAAAVLLLAR